MLRYDGEVAVVTGGGRGIGAEYAKLLASRGCRVVVNDLGVGLAGEPGAESPAAKIVAEIREAGGDAVADESDIVTDSRRLIERALQEYGRIDLVINNAGILRRNPFADVSEAELRSALDVHVVGSFLLTQAAWEHLGASGSGRVLLTSSANVWGAPGSIAYAAAKGAIIGLVATLALEGREQGIRVNGVLPTARTRMNSSTGQVITPTVQRLLTEHFDPLDVAAFVAWLMHAGNECSGGLFAAGGGRAARVLLSDARGGMIDDADPDSWSACEQELLSLEDLRSPASAAGSVFQRLAGMGIDDGDEPPNE